MSSVTGSAPFEFDMMEKCRDMEACCKIVLGCDFGSAVDELDCAVDWGNADSMKSSKWWSIYNESCKKAVCKQLGGHEFDGVLEVVCIAGGPISMFIASEMETIVSDAKEACTKINGADSVPDWKVHIRKLSVSQFLATYCDNTEGGDLQYVEFGVPGSEAWDTALADRTVCGEFVREIGEMTMSLGTVKCIQWQSAKCRVNVMLQLETGKAATVDSIKTTLEQMHGFVHAELDTAADSAEQLPTMTCFTCAEQSLCPQKENLLWRDRQSQDKVAAEVQRAPETRELLDRVQMYEFERSKECAELRGLIRAAAEASDKKHSDTRHTIDEALSLSENEVGTLRELIQQNAAASDEKHSDTRHTIDEELSLGQDAAAQLHEQIQCLADQTDLLVLKQIRQVETKFNEAETALAVEDRLLHEKRDTKRAMQALSVAQEERTERVQAQCALHLQMLHAAEETMQAERRDEAKALKQLEEDLVGRCSRVQLELTNTMTHLRKDLDSHTEGLRAGVAAGDKKTFVLEKAQFELADAMRSMKLDVGANTERLRADLTAARNERKTAVSNLNKELSRNLTVAVSHLGASLDTRTAKLTLETEAVKAQVDADVATKLSLLENDVDTRLQKCIDTIEIKMDVMNTRIKTEVEPNLKEACDTVSRAANDIAANKDRIMLLDTTLTENVTEGFQGLSDRIDDMAQGMDIATILNGLAEAASA